MRKKWASGVAASAILLLTCPAVCADFAALDAAIAEEMKKQGVPGAAVVVVREGSVVHSNAYGVQSVEQTTLVTRATLFRLGSTAKIVTALAAAALADSGKLDFETPIARYAEGLAPALGRLTMHQLLSHQAGLRDEAPMEGPLDESALGARVRSWGPSMFLAEPGRIFSYSNPGYVLAGYVIERIQGKPFSRAVEDLVLRPLGMTHSGYRPLDAMTRPLALGHQRTADGPQVIRPFAEHAGNYPPGSLFSSVDDLGRLLIALTTRSVSGVQRIAVPRAEIAPLERRYGYGLELRVDRGVAIIGHTGARAGYGSIVWLLPEQKSAVAIVANRTGAILFGSARKAVELLAPIADTPAPPEPGGIAMPAEEIARYVGRYAHEGLASVELVAEAGKLALRVGERTFEVVKIGEGRFRAAGARQLETFLLVADEEAGRPAYLAAEHWVLRRME